MALAGVAEPYWRHLKTRLSQVLEPLHDDLHLLCDAHRMALEVALGFGWGPPPERLVVCAATLTVLR